MGVEAIPTCVRLRDSENLQMIQARFHQIHTFGPIRPDSHSGEDPIANVTDVTPHIIRSGRMGP